MKTQVIAYPNDGRKLRQFLTTLLKKKLIHTARVLNYAKSYTLVDGKINKIEEKLVILQYDSRALSDLSSFIQKLHPYKDTDRIFLDGIEDMGISS